MTMPFTPPLPQGAVRGLAVPGAAHVARWRPGLGEGCRHGEIFAPADAAVGAALALALARDTAAARAPHDDTPDERPWLWVQDRRARQLGGRPYRPGLPEPLRHRLIHVAAETAEDALFALEEGLRCRDLAFVVGELAGNPRALDLVATRRLNLAAEQHGVPLWLVRLGAQRDLGAARMRWEVGPSPSPPPRWNPQAPGRPAWRAELFRAHTFQPGNWILHDAPEGLHAAAPGIGAGVAAAGAPDPRDLARRAGDRSLAAGQ